MRKVIMWDMVTLDGYFEGPGRDINWFVFDDELEQYILESQLEADTLLFGRVTYEMMAGYWPSAEGKIAEFMNSVPKVVFSRTLTSVDWNNARLVRDDAATEVAALKQHQGRDIFVFGSANFAATLIENNLVDEYRIGVNPLLLGRGIPLFKEGIPGASLGLVRTLPLRSGVVILHYQPRAQ